MTLTPNPQSGTPGQTLTFSGTLENTSASAVSINANGFTFDISGVGVVDDSPFLINVPLTLDAFTSSPSFEFLTVTIPGLQAPGPYWASSPFLAALMTWRRM